jgi:TRAP-type C4-dicarboxylate transport system permease small subunit
VSGHSGQGAHAADRAAAALDRGLRRLERIGDSIAGLLMLAMMAVVAGDVVLRYFFNRPLVWAYDLIGLYLMAGVFFFALTGTYSSNSHVGVDILVRRLPATGRRWAEMFTCMVALPLFILIGIAGAQRAWINWVNDDAMSGLIAWPTWIAAALVPFGCALLVLRLGLRLAGHAVSLASGRDAVALMPLDGHVEGE